jgi:hypothetical protein
MKQILRKFLLLLFLFSTTTIAAKNGAIVLSYEAFGPPAMAHTLIGSDWWQWQTHGESRPTQYDIKVVVYRGIPLRKVKARYPVVPKKNKDYRYVEYRAAITFLGEHIEENAIEDLTATLRQTKEKIQSALGSPR